MINLNKQRIAVYLYLSVVFVLIFGLSFNVQGNKITGSVILGTTEKIINLVSTNNFVLILFGFLLALVFALFIIKHSHQIKNEINHSNVKFISIIVIFLIAISFFSFINYDNIIDNKNQNNIVGDSITGAYLWENHESYEKVVKIDENDYAVFKMEGSDQLYVAGLRGSVRGVIKKYNPNSNSLGAKVSNQDTLAKGKILSGVYTVHRRTSGRDVMIDDNLNVYEFSSEDGKILGREIKGEEALDFLIGAGIAQPVRSGHSINTYNNYGKNRYVRVGNKLHLVTDNKLGKVIPLSTLKSELLPNNFAELLIDSDLGNIINVGEEDLSTFNLLATRTGHVFHQNLNGKWEEVTDDNKFKTQALIGVDYYTKLTQPSGKEFVSYVNPAGEVKFRPLKDGVPEEELLAGDPDIAELEEQRQKVLASRYSQKQIIDNAAYKATSALLDLTLGKFAYGYITDYCKEQYYGSDYAGDTDYPESYNTQPLLTGKSYGEPANP